MSSNFEQELEAVKRAYEAQTVAFEEAIRSARDLGNAPVLVHASVLERFDEICLPTATSSLQLPYALRA